jgi:hypothetical protein
LFVVRGKREVKWWGVEIQSGMGNFSPKKVSDGIPPLSPPITIRPPPIGKLVQQGTNLLNVYLFEI